MNEQVRYDFIINPVSGKGERAETLKRELQNLSGMDGAPEFRIHTTNGMMDGRDTAARLVQDAHAAGVSTRIFACGGDGTANEVANGVYDGIRALGGVPEAAPGTSIADAAVPVAMGILPIGSGNDFVRYFNKERQAADFLNIRKQMSGTMMSSDLLRLTWEENGELRERCCLNGLNIGIDGNACISAHELRKYPLIKGSFSYVLGVASNAIRMHGANLQIEADGEEFHHGKLLLCTASNGRYCGGGVESCPRAQIDDGLMELLMITQVSRRMLTKLFPSYKKGELLENPIAKDFIKYRQAKKVTIHPLDGRMKFVVDGEFFDTGKLTIEVAERVLPFVIPER